MQLAQLKATIKGLFLALGVAGLVSCGSGDEAGGGGSCGGADESGICLQVNLIEPVHLDGAISLAVDVDAIADCIAGLPLDPEPFTEHEAAITFSATLVSGNPVAASFVQITGMVVTFTQNTTDPLVTCVPAAPTSAPCTAVPGPGPAIAQLTTGVDVFIPVGTSVTQTLPMMNGERLNLYTAASGFDIFTAGPFDPIGDNAFLSYTVRYLFTGEDEFGNSVDATGATQVSIGAYDNC